MKSVEEIEQIRKQKREELDLRVNLNSATREKHILVCRGTGCTSSKSPEIIENFKKIIEEKKGNLIITADHGNADQMIDYKTGEPHTAHTTNPVPIILVTDNKELKLKNDGKLADLAPTMLELMGIEKPAEMTGESLLTK